MPIFTSKSSPPRSALRVCMASRMRSAAAMARSGVGNVAMTASPIVLTTAPASAATISLRTPKCARTRSNAARSPTRWDSSDRSRERRHDRVADRLDHGAGLGGDDLVEDAEMRPDQIERREIADPLVQLGRAFEIGEQKGQAGDFQSLMRVDRVGTINVAEGLVGQQTLGGQERPPVSEQFVQRIAGNPDGRQYPRLGAVFP